MKDSVTLNSFPSTRVDALTMLYLQNQDISKMTPEELAETYSDVFLKIKSSFNAISKKNRVIPE